MPETPMMDDELLAWLEAHFTPAERQMLWLELLDRIRPKGMRLSSRMIGEMIGCTGSNVWQVEQRIMQKLRRAGAKLERIAA
jgi:DNA-directed RNA polymerase sigma subunit (sigma70/sigma32)